MAEIILNEEENINVTLKDEEVINVSLKEEEPINTEVPDINYVPGYAIAEAERRAYYEDFKERVDNGEFDGEPGPVGPPGPAGKDGTMNFEELTDEQRESLRGPKGEPGKDGYTPIKGVDYFDGEEGYTPVKDVDYFDGKDGKDGYTPVKGVDYFDGKDGKDGPTYIAGKNIEITEDNVINCTVEGGGGVSEEIDPTVPSYVKEITEEDISNWNNKSEFSGDYNDLSNKPAIPTVPANVSEFANDAGYITEIPSEYVTESELDGKGYITDLSNYYTKEETDAQIGAEISPLNSDVNSLDNRLSRLSGYVDEETDLTTEANTITGAINEVKAGIQTNKQLINLIYPVGSIYISANETNPNTLFGVGTWERLKNGFVYGATGGFSQSSITGTSTGSYSGTSGSYSGTSGAYSGTSGSTAISVDQMPEHNHTLHIPMNTPSTLVKGYGLALSNEKRYPAAIDSDTGGETGGTYIGKRGGGKGHTHSIPSHTHSIPSHTHSIPSHTHAVPYIACVIWRRTA